MGRLEQPFPVSPDSSTFLPLHHPPAATTLGHSCNLPPCCHCPFTKLNSNGANLSDSSACLSLPSENLKVGPGACILRGRGFGLRVGGERVESLLLSGSSPLALTLILSWAGRAGAPEKAALSVLGSCAGSLLSVTAGGAKQRKDGMWEGGLGSAPPHLFLLCSHRELLLGFFSCFFSFGPGHVQKTS